LLIKPESFFDEVIYRLFRNAYSPLRPEEITYSAKSTGCGFTGPYILDIGRLMIHCGSK
jgi:hypothetical protein